MQYGIDVSHHQTPAKLPWSTFKGKVDFVIVRANYGTAPDKAAEEHIQRARDIGAAVGLYSFYRPSQPRMAQQDVFFEQIYKLCRIGDIAPALDIEKDPYPSPGLPVTALWSPLCREYAQSLEREFGDVLIYITQAEWKLLGSPDWVLQYPLWVAHYTANAKPLTPGNKEHHIWQHRVAPFLHNGPGGLSKNTTNNIDQNRALKPLPNILRMGPRKILIPDDLDDRLDEGILQCFDYTPLDE